METFPVRPFPLPTLLSEIPDKPKRLFIRGEFPSESLFFLAIVGSRTYTPYGASVCENIVRGLRGFPFVIVSGLALGIDGIAHASALQAGLPTVAVPGSGLDDSVLYPRVHHALARAILEAGGALISEFPPDWKPRPESFPKRNRIMAGLCHATLVIEAEEKSGTLITARLATEYNREVLAVPHDVRSPTCKGPHQLLKTGASLIEHADDILTLFGIQKEEKKKPQENYTPQETLLLSLLPRPRDELVTLLATHDIGVSEANILIASLELRDSISEKGGLVVPL
jgi:DNA processing protein